MNVKNVVHRICENFKKSPQMRDLLSSNETAAYSRTCLCGYREGESPKKKEEADKNEKVTDAMRAT